MSIGSVANSIFRNGLTAVCAGVGGAILGGALGYNPNILKESEDRKSIIYIVSCAAVTFACLSGKEIARSLISNNLKWSILKPTGEIISEVAFGIATLFLLYQGSQHFFKGSDSMEKSPSARRL